MYIRPKKKRAFHDTAAAGELHPGPDTVQAKPAPALQDGIGVETLPIIPDRHPDPVALETEQDRDLRRFRMPDAILDTFLDRAEENQLLPGLDLPGVPFDCHLRPDKARLIDPVDLLDERLLQAPGLDAVAAEAPGEVPQVGHGLTDILPDILQHPLIHLITLVHDIDLNLGEAQDLPDIVMDLLADRHEGLLLDLQLCL